MNIVVVMVEDVDGEAVEVSRTLFYVEWTHFATAIPSLPCFASNFLSDEPKAELSSFTLSSSFLHQGLNSSINVYFEGMDYVSTKPIDADRTLSLTFLSAPNSEAPTSIKAPLKSHHLDPPLRTLPTAVFVSTRMAT